MLTTDDEKTDAGDYHPWLRGVKSIYKERYSLRSKYMFENSFVPANQHKFKTRRMGTTFFKVHSC